MKRLRDQTLTEAVRDTPTRPLTEVDQYCLAIIDSTRPPPMAPMTPARAALAMRMPSKSAHDLTEAALEEVREQVASFSAAQIAQANADKLDAIAAEAALRKAWWMGILGDVVKWAAILILNGLLFLLWTAIKHAP